MRFPCTHVRSHRKSPCCNFKANLSEHTLLRPRHRMTLADRAYCCRRCCLMRSVALVRTSWRRIKREQVRKTLQVYSPLVGRVFCNMRRHHGVRLSASAWTRQLQDVRITMTSTSSATGGVWCLARHAFQWTSGCCPSWLSRALAYWVERRLRARADFLVDFTDNASGQGRVSEMRKERVL